MDITGEAFEAVFEAEMARLADTAERQQADADRLMARSRSISREFKAERSQLSELIQLRYQAVRLARRAGVRGVSLKTFEGRTRNQLLNAIHEMNHYLGTKEA